MRISIDQRKSLSTYSGNLSIAWFAAGFIGPIVTKQTFNEIGWIMFFSLAIAGTFLIFMLILIKERKRKK
ncbi:hypothetical protein COW38_00115 [Candidatus Collierbacteria bacterium CG17_big_fil_post_rev_8_21_14_2_50_45_7]|uniref:Major facilitator superfamily (MFS) profile domain-containing protein n=1 Tax=Candidatus Collierbacteria bacterium CG17_big_fil_post_rev_8_21_14_2_50_45_7 TaxID=1974536 RepID=A0A2M7FSJ0_9BACT|nr:MAG: hypothetical protein COW38_00115 [Candidatus Collierbacteria bacterium CG17_big_fil_post_rev_8_21_14_2_50_45_7]